MSLFMHKSILVNEFLSLFSTHPITTFIDGTLGAGGHAASILDAHPEIELLIGIDQDPLALELAAKRLEKHEKRVHLAHGNYSQIAKITQNLGITSVDGIFLDLGVSSMQLDLPEKGFSFSKDGPLDMRMDPSSPLTAEEIVNTWPFDNLAKIFRDYGEEPRWRQAARAIVDTRERHPLKTTSDLVRALQPALPMRRGMKISPFTLVFQALRLAVNKELEHLEKTLPQAIDLLSDKGRLGVIAFHSLEDRIVKNTFRDAASTRQPIGDDGAFYLDKKALVTILTKKPLIPTDEEIRSNPRARSAKMRFVEKLPS